MNAFLDSSRAFLFTYLLLVMEFFTDPQKIDNFIFLDFVDLMMSHFYLTSRASNSKLMSLFSAVKLQLISLMPLTVFFVEIFKTSIKDLRTFPVR